MYAVVGCRNCSALWVIEGRPETSECPRCGHRRQYEKLRKFVTTEDRAHAREVRASMLANRQGEGEAFAELDDYEQLEARLDEAGVDDQEYLRRSGVDPDAVEAAGETVEDGSGGSKSRPEIVRAALREHDRPDEATVVEYASERGVPASATRDILEELLERGELVESGDGYRLL